MSSLLIRGIGMLKEGDNISIICKRQQLLAQVIRIEDGQEHDLGTFPIKEIASPHGDLVDKDKFRDEIVQYSHISLKSVGEVFDKIGYSVPADKSDH